jgi:hypothetical protein
MKYIALTLVAVVVAAFALAACGGSSPDPLAPYKSAAANLAPEKSAAALTKTLRGRGDHVSGLTCVDVSAKRQRCSGTVNGQAHEWRVDIDLATGTRDFVVTK